MPIDTDMKRTLDIIISFMALVILSPLLACISIVIKITSEGSTLYWSDRIGKDNILFKMPKFRTMRIDTPIVASHLLANPDHWVTPSGAFLRKTSLDELPQIWSILIGDMSLVGPRPALFNQVDLIRARTAVGVHQLRPGLTGWAQINGRDEVSIEQKVALDHYYQQCKSFMLDIKILTKTVIKVFTKENVSH